MNKQDAIYIAACIMCVVFVISYISVTIFSISLPRYYPLTDEWKMIKEKGAISMGWYGQTFFALLITIIIGVISFIYLKSINISKQWFSLIRNFALIALIAFMVFYAQHEYFHWIIR